MIVMTSAVAVALLFNAPHLAEVNDIFSYFHGSHDHGLLEPNPDGLPVWPLLFVTITCGAISGFHSTQSPMIARCLTNEKYARPVFYGAMMCEGIVACVWLLKARSTIKTRCVSSATVSLSGLVRWVPSSVTRTT